jgi:hypothetical protein
VLCQNPNDFLSAEILRHRFVGMGPLTTAFERLYGLPLLSQQGQRKGIDRKTVLFDETVELLSQAMIVCPVVAIELPEQRSRYDVVPVELNVHLISWWIAPFLPMPPFHGKASQYGEDVPLSCRITLLRRIVVAGKPPTGRIDHEALGSQPQSFDRGDEDVPGLMMTPALTVHAYRFDGCHSFYILPVFPSLGITAAGRLKWNMPARVIYLDQNKWIELARTVNGKATPALIQVLDILRESKRLGLNVFPLSLGHFIETNKRRDLESRSRLGSLMWELCDNLTLAAPTAIQRRELDRAISITLNRRLNERPFSLLGQGLAHASDNIDARIRLDPDRLLPDDLRAALEKQADRLLTESVLTGVSPWGEPAKPDLSGPAKKFSDGLLQARARLLTAAPDLQKRAGYAQVLADMLEDIQRALAFHSIPEAEFFSLGGEGFTRFVDAMPSIRLDMHLRQQWVRNPQLKTRPSDLNDFGYVGTAAAYCDVVVTENQLANLLNRDKKKKATVISNLADLPRV